MSGVQFHREYRVARIGEAMELHTRHPNPLDRQPTSEYRQPEISISYKTLKIQSAV